MLRHEEQMLSAKLNQIKALNHQHRSIQKERKYLLKLIDERLYKIEDIKKHLEEQSEVEKQKHEERRILHSQCSIQFNKLFQERKLREEQNRNKKKEEEVNANQ